MKRTWTALIALVLTATILGGCGSTPASTSTPPKSTAPPASTAQPASTEDKSTPDESAAAPTGTGEKTKIKFGTIATFIEYCDFMPDKMEPDGYDIELIVFDDVVTPNIALEEGSIDVALFQHKVYLDAFNESNDTHLVALEPYIRSTAQCLISNFYTSPDEIPDGAKGAISDDPSNLQLNLLGLQHFGLIKLSDTPSDGKLYTVYDIVENPKNIEFVELPLAQKYGALPDVDFIIEYYREQNLKPENNILGTTTELVKNNELARFPFVAVVHESNVDAPWVKDFMDALAGDEIRDLVERENEVIEVHVLLY